MKARLPRLAAATVVLALGASGAFAHDVQYEGDTYHRISHQIAQPARAAVGQQGALGYAVTGPAARVVLLDGSVRHLNVTQGESVTFRLPSKERVGWEFETQSPPTAEEFTWNFDTLGTPTFDLAEVVRKGIDVGQVEVHVAPNPLYGGG